MSAYPYINRLNKLDKTDKTAAQSTKVIEGKILYYIAHERLDQVIKYTKKF